MFQTLSTKIVRLFIGTALLVAGMIVASPLSTAYAKPVTDRPEPNICSQNGRTFGPYLFAGNATTGQTLTYHYTKNGHIITQVIHVTSGGNPFTATLTIYVSGCGDGVKLPNFTDGRCNQDPNQSFAVYPDGKGGFTFFALFNGQGTLALTVTDDQLDANPANGSFYLIAQNLGVQLYRMPDGSLEAVRNDVNNQPYSYIFTPDTCGGVFPN